MTIEMLREYKVFGYAVFDLVISLLGIYLLAPLLSKFFLMFRIEIPRRSWLYLTLPLSILIHMAVGNFTPMTKNFLDLQGNYVLKIIVIGLLTLGLRGIKVLK